MNNLYKLTPREEEVKMLLLKGYNNSEIAKVLFVSKHTAKAHVCNILSKLCLKNRYEFFICEINKYRAVIIRDTDMNIVFQKIKEVRNDYKRFS